MKGELKMTTIARPSAKRKALAINVVTHCLYLLTLPIWYLLNMFSVMLFDSPDAEQYWAIWLFYYAIKVYPYVVIGSIALAWVIYGKGIYNRTYLVNVIPGLLIVACAGLVVIFGE
jgi:hypothetical protein